jgi:thymidylate synthase
LLWFLRGDTSIDYLLKNDCHIWDGDAYKSYLSKWNYESFPNDGSVVSVEPIKVEPHTKEQFIYRVKTDNEFAKKWGELGPIYGKQWRNWETDDTDAPRYEHWKTDIDQISNLIHDLKTNPDSRRLMVNAWNVGELDSMVLPPCHYGFQVYTRELTWEERFDIHKKYITEDKLDLVFELATNKNLDKLGVPTRAISLMWNQRSVDTFLGLPFNIASYGLLLEIIAKAVNMVPDELIGNLGDTHLYSNHIEQAKEQIGRELSESERYRIFEDRGYEFRMVKDWSKEEQYDKAGIPKRTREPYPLPTLKHMKTDEFYKSLSEDVSLFTHLDNTDFVVEGYQSHPIIKAPLSN